METEFVVDKNGDSYWLAFAEIRGRKYLAEGSTRFSARQLIIGMIMQRENRV
jgi:hypothetical protein